MATFRAIVQGNRGEASRLGSKAISASVNGWNLGISVEGRRDDKTGKVTFYIYSTGGSNGGSPSKLIKTIKQK